MKRVMLWLVFGSVLILSACGDGSTEYVKDETETLTDPDTGEEVTLDMNHHVKIEHSDGEVANYSHTVEYPREMEGYGEAIAKDLDQSFIDTDENMAKHYTVEYGKGDGESTESITLMIDFAGISHDSDGERVVELDIFRENLEHTGFEAK